ncbi:hypothetical protein Pmani_009774 [Petrolisthes manimaculis]|uniref:Uncharacterized protein n=1 Tax=Petrolisthes manimaculis TaxID=1843537 RepID=A0AAE1Q4D8_9EUCA|nr:hypothetical protein Pmani_020945 [Petrolisthes manimaculis]KAK4309826.1 hypothetical protein Pmani_018587 [Petrolisthes manimaculis]KAK4319315.1 hypothetical protein Pmani_009774 [Petrolisthes manimaculis]
MNQEKNGRLIFRTQGEFYQSFATLVKSGGHIFIDGALTIKILTARMFSQTGQCEYSMSRDGFLPYYGVVASQKDSLLTPALSKR